MCRRLAILTLFVALSALGIGWMAQAQNRDEKGAAGKKPAAKSAAPAAQEKSQDKSHAADDEKAIRAGAAAYVKAYNAHDAKALAELFALRAEFVNEAGDVVRGREAIEKNFIAVFAGNPDAQLEIEVEAVHFMTPSIAIEHGAVRARPSAKEPFATSRYVAINVKPEGKWLVGSVRDFPAEEGQLTNRERLQPLAWLVGDWVDESPDAVVVTSCKWVDNDNFLLQEFDVQVAGKVAMHGTSRIGWDPLTKQIKSWVFDNTGGHSEGLWTRVGDDWIVKSQGVTTNGQAASATNMYRFVDPETLLWSSHDRVVGGERGEDVGEIIMKKAPPGPGE